jgi:hypothetical protein
MLRKGRLSGGLQVEILSIFLRKKDGWLVHVLSPTPPNADIRHHGDRLHVDATGTFHGHLEDLGDYLSMLLKRLDKNLVMDRTNDPGIRACEGLRKQRQRMFGDVSSSPLYGCIVASGHARRVSPLATPATQGPTFSGRALFPYLPLPLDHPRIGGKEAFTKCGGFFHAERDAIDISGVGLEPCSTHGKDEAEVDCLGRLSLSSGHLMQRFIQQQGCRQCMEILPRWYASTIRGSRLSSAAMRSSIWE